MEAARRHGRALWAREASQSSTFSGTLTLKGGTVAIAQFVPKASRPARVLIPLPDRQSESKEIISGQWAYGLGRVTAIAFDLDRPPFTEFALRTEFWDWVLREGGATRASAGSEGKPRPGGAGLSEEEDELSVALRTHADTFESVPVVSFGWLHPDRPLHFAHWPGRVLLPQRVLGRLELTWITFPIIVLTVSLAAYFTAYSMKGRELKINKIDVVDFDPVSGRVYGTTLFTLFSPRIDDYTIGVSPGDGWSAEPESTGTAVSWVGAPRGGRASLLRRTYRYHTGDGRVADGLEKVPVQVWSTKSFTANWTATIDRDLFEPKPSDPNSPTDVENARRMQLKHPAADLMAVEGWFVNRLPVPVLTDCVLFYAGKAYPIPGGTIRAGETIKFPLETGQMANDWLKKESKLEDLLRRAPIYAERLGAAKAAGPQVAPQAGATTATAGTGWLPLYGMLFHESSLTYGEGVIPRNALSFRRLDQSWRLTSDNRGEVILVGRAAPAVGPAEETLSGAYSPTRLWLRGLQHRCGADADPGTGRQETWVEYIYQSNETHMIECRDLTKKYNDLFAVDRLSLKLDKGDDVWLHRPERVGKTTTMRMLATLLNRVGRGDCLWVFDLHRLEGNPPLDRLHARLLRRLRRHEGDRIPRVLRGRLSHHRPGPAEEGRSGPRPRGPRLQTRRGSSRASVAA